MTLKHFRKFAAASAAALATVALVAGCAANSGTQTKSSGNGSSAQSFAGKTLTVWFMQGTLDDTTTNVLKTEFEKETGATLNIQTEQWANIVPKLTTALATTDPPDVIQIGNTDVPLYAASGALANLDSYKSQFAGSSSWLPGLLEPAMHDGHLFAVPMYGANRIVVYNKKIWKDAGITTVPTTYSDLKADLDKIKAKNPSPAFSALPLQGNDFYNALAWIYDAGGSLAEKTNGKWTGNLSSAASLNGLKEYQAFENAYSVTSQRSLKPGQVNQDEVFAKGQASAILDKPGGLTTILAANPGMKDDIGSFTLPSMSHPGELAPTFLGGSDLAVAARSKQLPLAVKFLKLISSPNIQTNYIAIKSNNIPASGDLAAKLEPKLSEFLRPSYVAAAKNVVVPTAAGWVTVEGDSSVNDFFIQVSENKIPIATLAKQFDAHLTSALNQSTSSVK